MPAVHLEVEKKYSADDAFELPPLTDLVLDGAVAVDSGGPVVEGDPVQQQLDATYFDTADLRLAAAGLTLRRRTGGDDAGWHLKVPAGGSARSEVRLPLGRAWRTVPQTLRRMVRAHTRGAVLQAVAEISTDRTVRRLVDATGQVLAEVADDRVTARRILTAADGDGAGEQTSWREIEVELTGGAAELLDAVDARLRERGLASAGSSSKLAHVLAGAGGGSGTPGKGKGKGKGKGRKGAAGKSGKRSGKLTAKSYAGAVVLAHIREQVEQIRNQDLPVRLDAADSVHKMRVATRRLRSALTTFKPLFDAEVARPLRGELKWLAAELGAARDAEVMRDRVAGTVGGDEEAGAQTSADVVEELDRAYREAHDRVLAELDGERYHRLLASLDDLVETPPFTARATERAGTVLPRLVGRSYTIVRRLVEDADARPAGEEREELLHDARKTAKAARYAGESVSRAFGADATAFAEAMEAVQEALGEHQDSVLIRERLRTRGLAATSTEAAFLYGRLHGLEEVRSEQSQHRFDDAWKAAGRKSLHRWTR
ncbi:CYTH and CHAD domain-containing protein [Blastococcus sp. VKM Ac-2987]|uniref:CYTH and CHAD domain-containing protein n=1 Tax=Blastococcus sp. VKM Ac-2987 TaxID=3004141 RepID=UPI0022AB70E7|nr:CYTH and CHAD domain-containing protein [Blastococcus sp. VKM Ac-2987]MCZ2857220.1 CYTH and CHAD domain-containing protein [Blastococcus sp. VKM Ac-2987]